MMCAGGVLTLPDPALVMISREHGGNVLVLPPREVWDRSELTPAELTSWSFLASATARAMLDVLPQLEGGCINYWDAGNWALNEEAEPKGLKRADQYRRLHLHLLGRSRASKDPAWAWGEAPQYCAYRDRFEWSAGRKLLSADECSAIVTQCVALLTERYGFQADQIEPWSHCSTCGYPTPANGSDTRRCPECRDRGGE